MRFDDFDKQMRVYEQSLDQNILPDMYMVARLDGRGFTKFTKKAGFEKPFDESFRDLMSDTVKYLMTESGFNFIYGFTESDEISLLFAPDDQTFGRKVRKLNTTLASCASAYFTTKYKEYLYDNSIVDLELARHKGYLYDDSIKNLYLSICTFDCRIIPLPNKERVADCFLWRQEDANRNALNGWCYWTLRKEGKSKREATSILSGKGVAFKNELLLQRGINYNDVPSWQKRGVGFVFEEMEKEGMNPITGEKIKTKRRELVEKELPIGEEYKQMILRMLN